jgi:hypothetical protein
LFLGWKHGMVRAAEGDSHITALFAQCVVLAFALSLVPLAAPVVDRLAPARCWIVSLLALTLAQWMHIGSLEDGIALAIKRISLNTRILLRPERHRRWLDEEWDRARDRMALPTARRLIGAEPVGRYAVRIRFSDGHDTGLYTWSLLRELAEQPDARLGAYLGRLSAAGLRRD